MTTDETPQAIFERIQRYPSILSELKDYQLEMAEEYGDALIEGIKNEQWRALEPYVTLPNAREMIDVRKQPFTDQIDRVRRVLDAVHGQMARRELNKGREKLER